MDKSVEDTLQHITLEVSQRVIVEVANNDAVSPPQSDNQSLESFNLLSSKQANNIISVGDELALQAEKKKEYINEWQLT